MKCDIHQQTVNGLCIVATSATSAEWKFGVRVGSTH